MTLRERIRDFIWMLFRDPDICPKCKEYSVIYASNKPFVSCGYCGWALREGYINKELRG